MLISSQLVKKGQKREGFCLKLLIPFVIFETVKCSEKCLCLKKKVAKETYKPSDFSNYSLD